MERQNCQAFNHFVLRILVMALAFWLALSGISLSAHAAELGKGLIFSRLGEPLRAEIAVSATRDELSGMVARLASKESLTQAGLDYVTSLPGLNFSIDQQDSGDAVIRLTSTTPINEPFIDILIELDWPTGRLFREFTFLLDPPEGLTNNGGPTGPLMVNLPELPDVSDASSGIEQTLLPAVAEARETTASMTIREVKRGDTLSKIARSVKPEGVSLEQMRVSLFRANQEAFDGGNMNRLRAGKVLVIPGQSSLETIPVAAAKKIVVAQSADWNAYRSKLAALAAKMPVKDTAGKQEDAGRLTAKLDEKALASVASKDRLSVSTTDVESMQPARVEKKTEEDLVAKAEALKEASERLALLEKNIANLQKLLDLKTQNPEEAQPLSTDNASPLKVKKAVEAPKAKKKQKTGPV